MWFLAIVRHGYILHGVYVGHIPLYIFMISMRSLLIEFDDSNKRFKEFFRSMKSPPDEQKCIERFLVLTKRHYYLIKKVQKADQLFKLFTLAMIALWLPTTIFTPVTLVRTNWSIQMAIQLYDVARSIFHFYGLCIMPAQVHTKSQATTILLNNEICKRVENVNHAQSITPLIKTFAESVTNTNSGITVGGMILIRKSMILTCQSKFVAMNCIIRPLAFARLASLLVLLLNVWTSMSNAQTKLFTCTNSVYKKDNVSCTMLVPPILSHFKAITALAYNSNAKTLYFTTEEKCGKKTSFFATKGDVSRCHYYGYGLKKIAFDWVTTQIYIAVDGKGIGVCTIPNEDSVPGTNSRRCSHLITVHRYQTAEGYTHLLVHPKRGILIWLDHNKDYPKGVVMCAGMDGNKSRVLMDGTGGKISSIALDYAGDQLFIAHEKGLRILSFKNMRKTALNTATDSSRSRSSLVSRNGTPEFISECMMSPKEIEPIAISDYNGDEDYRFPFACDKCQHMCVLSEAVPQIPVPICIVVQDNRLKQKKSNEENNVSWKLMLFFSPTIVIILISTASLAYETVISHMIYAEIVNS
ncbi:Receptor Mediated Endocytosis [Ditylenchus destructor]|uniref:Receptor Mediated Endocytosis n=1 Tax=Ditylenchus destructor TaxID=166010 RepID=A0AAD4R1P6_9BILA|nr:Receptor Mediated Endocytosis [Ditylenchus destructor]